METLLQNKVFIKVMTVLGILLSIFVLVLTVHQIIDKEKNSKSGQPVPTISVSGDGDVMAVSNIATLSITLSKDSKTAADAQKLLNDSVTKTLAYLTTAKIADKDIKSEYGGLSPKYSYEQVVCIAYPCPQKDPKIIGYTATQSITVKVRAVDDANIIKTGLATVGVTDISGPTFSIDNEDAYRDQAREKAIVAARAKAELLAGQLNVRLGKITNFSENNGSAYPMMYAAKAMDSAVMSPSAPAPTLPKGENKITSSVTITYEIK